MGVLSYSFNVNISLKMSYGVLECTVILQNYMLMIFVIKRGIFVPDPVYYLTMCNSPVR